MIPRIESVFGDVHKSQMMLIFDSADWREAFMSSLYSSYGSEGPGFGCVGYRKPICDRGVKE